MSSRPYTPHHESKLFPCEWCHALFIHDSELYIHQRHECHRKPNYTRYPCKACPRSFYSQSSLQMHMESHLQLLCDVCPFRCYGQAELIQHLRVHNQRETNWVHRRRSQRKRKNVQCTVCKCSLSYGGKALSPPKDPRTEVTIKVESTSSVSEVKIKLEPSSDEYRRKTNIERFRETGDMVYLEHTMKEILEGAPGLLKMWYEKTFERPFPLSTDRDPDEPM